MWFVGHDKQKMLDTVDNHLASIFIFQSIGLVIFGIVVYLFGSRLIKPLKNVTGHLVKISEGRFDLEIPDTRLKDEIGDIVRASRAMQNSTRNIIKTILEESESIDEVIMATVKNMNDLKKDMQEASATTEQLSAGMQETAASLQEMNATSVQIEAAVDNMAKRASEGSRTVEEIKMRAADLRQKAIESKTTALELLGRSQKDLETAIKNSRSIEQIQLLTDAILEVAVQTNMLSLNAAIEASRAGNMAPALQWWQMRSESLPRTPKRLWRKSAGYRNGNRGCRQSCKVFESIVAFIGDRVVHDYDNLVETGERYDLDARYVNDMMQDVSSTSEQLMASISNLMKAINDVSMAANEGATGTSQLAEMIARVADKSGDVVEMAGKANRSVTTLKEYVHNFTI